MYTPIIAQIRKLALFGKNTDEKVKQIWDSMDYERRVWSCRDSGACEDISLIKRYSKVGLAQLPTKVRNILTPYLDRRYF